MRYSILASPKGTDRMLVHYLSFSMSYIRSIFQRADTIPTFRLAVADPRGRTLVVSEHNNLRAAQWHGIESHGCMGQAAFPSQVEPCASMRVVQRSNHVGSIALE